ncbi:orotidine-5'-phosphate decarboxylase [Azospirillum fermentarium]|uniref:orotidine-5'-phosphate decarboxylase n=1 Tax=Azospirillum fermentarium TaxID=1233114 RepID=UPI00222765F6|nr:orotidine-5'-phosphate decarboxylase [Azospirillum fermentarium]MCW2245106.1 orotidine-5'-phosphate decarboxylase [Azospirillum fermentarium]
MTAANPVFVSIDTTAVDTARTLAQGLAGLVGGVKLGLEFFVAQGPAGVRAVLGGDSEVPFFLDLKLHDIPNTVAGGVRAALPLTPAFMTIHTSGGPAMMRAAAEAAAAGGAKRPRILGVTVLTSLDDGDLGAVGQSTPVAGQVERLARLARDCGLDGVVCSPNEVAALRAACGPDFILMVPGIRPAWAAVNDQKRIMTPAQAMAAGASHLVIGRPITAEPDPADAARRINAELGL